MKKVYFNWLFRTLKIEFKINKNSWLGIVFLLLPVVFFNFFPFNYFNKTESIASFNALESSKSYAHKKV